MVSLEVVQASNACIPTSLPSGLVAVFVGGTSGIGEYTLKEFARYAREPRIYVIGRSKQASERIAAECWRLNANVKYTFIKADVSLIRSVDAVCDQIKAVETTVNVLFLSAGTLAAGKKTEEGLNSNASLKLHSRARFIFNLLPLLKAATSIRRVVSVLCGTKEGAINLDNLQCWNARPSDMMKTRGHNSSIVTLIHAHFAQQAPTVSFIHDFPGNVKSAIARGTTGALSVVFMVYNLLGSLIYIPNQESGERHLFFATSARFQAKEGLDEGVPLIEGLGLARGIDGRKGSGVYSCDQVNESAGHAVEELLSKYKKEGQVGVIWKMFEEDYKQIGNLKKK